MYSIIMDQPICSVSFLDLLFEKRIAIKKMLDFDFKYLDGQENRNFVTSWSVHVRMSRIMTNIKAVKRKTLNAENLYKEILILG